MYGDDWGKVFNQNDVRTQYGALFSEEGGRGIYIK